MRNDPIRGTRWLDGWSNVTVRRLSDEISYSQPTLYAHFGSREGILAEIAIEGFEEIALALEKARKGVKVGDAVESVATAYPEFAVSSPALQGGRRFRLA